MLGEKQLIHVIVQHPEQLFDFSGGETHRANFVFPHTKVRTESRQLVSLALAFAA